MVVKSIFAGFFMLLCYYSEMLVEKGLGFVFVFVFVLAALIMVVRYLINYWDFTVPSYSHLLVFVDI